jgi:hypothetical protein
MELVELVGGHHTPFGDDAGDVAGGGDIETGVKHFDTGGSQPLVADFVHLFDVPFLDRDLGAIADAPVNAG